MTLPSSSCKPGSSSENMAMLYDDLDDLWGNRFAGTALPSSKKRKALPNQDCQEKGYWGECVSTVFVRLWPKVPKYLNPD